MSEATNNTGGAAAQGGAPGAAQPGFGGGQAMAQQAAAEQQKLQAEQLRKFWGEMKKEAVEHSTEPADFKNQQLPLARIKKIMKSDEDVRMISAEAPVLFAKACEYFILELTQRAWGAAEEGKRRTLQRSDVSAAIQSTDIFDFLVDTVPREDGGEPGDAPAPAAAAVAPAALGMGVPMYAPLPGMPAGYMMPGAAGMGMPPQYAAFPGVPGMMFAQQQQAAAAAAAAVAAAQQQQQQAPQQVPSGAAQQ